MAVREIGCSERGTIRGASSASSLTVSIIWARRAFRGRRWPLAGGQRKSGRGGRRVGNPPRRLGEETVVARRPALPGSTGGDRRQAKFAGGPGESKKGRGRAPR